VRVELAHEWPDADASNGRVELPVVLPSFNPLDACPAVDSPLLGLEVRRECGWLRAPLPDDGTCVPGDPMAFGCIDCSARPLLRMCPGADACIHPAAIAFATGSLDLDDCGSIQGTCPASGQYSVLLSTDDPAWTGSPCTLVAADGVRP